MTADERPSGDDVGGRDEVIDPVLAAHYRQVAAGAAASAAVAAAQTAEPATTMLRLNPAALAAHRRRERRRTLTFLAIFVSVLALGGAAFSFFQGLWDWPFGQDRVRAVPCPVASSVGLPAGQVSVRVYNGTTRKGLAAKVAKGLSGRDFEILEVGNDPLEETPKATALIRHGAAGLPAAKTLAAHFDGEITTVDDGRLSQSVDLVLGKAYKKLVAPQAAAKKLTPVAAPSPAGCVPVPADDASPAGSPSATG